MSMRSRPSRSRLSSSERRTPSARVVEDDPPVADVLVVGVVPAVERLVVDVGAGRDAVGWPDEAPDLRRQDVVVARSVAQGRTEPALAGPVAVERSDVEGADRPGPRRARRSRSAWSSSTARNRPPMDADPNPSRVTSTSVRPIRTRVNGSYGIAGRSLRSTPEAIDATPSPRVSFNPSSTGQYTER